jgi:hypothetical protein
MWLAQFVCAPQFFKTPKGLCGHTVYQSCRTSVRFTYIRPAERMYDSPISVLQYVCTLHLYQSCRTSVGFTYISPAERMYDSPISVLQDVCRIHHITVPQNVCRMLMSHQRFVISANILVYPWDFFLWHQYKVNFPNASREDIRKSGKSAIYA